jgi:hypothetical protein
MGPTVAMRIEGIVSPSSSALLVGGTPTSHSDPSIADNGEESAVGPFLVFEAFGEACNYLIFLIVHFDQFLQGVVLLYCCVRQIVKSRDELVGQVIFQHTPCKSHPAASYSLDVSVLL